MDVTTVGWLAFWASLGYLLIGLGTGAVISNMVYEDGGDVSDSYVMGGLATALWPLAWIAGIAALIWFYGIANLLTPRKYREKVKTEKEKRRAEGQPLRGSYVD